MFIAASKTLTLLFYLSIGVCAQLLHTGIFSNPETGGLSGARNMVISSDGKFLYVTSEIDSAISVFSRDSGSGNIELEEVHVQGQNGVAGMAAVRALSLSPDGQQLYASSQISDSLVVFSRNISNGTLQYLEAHPIWEDSISTDGLNAASLAVSPDGKFVYAGQVSEGLICIYARNVNSGSLTAKGCQGGEGSDMEGLYGITSIAFGTHNEIMYTTGKFNHNLMVFKRNANTGLLSLIQNWVNGDGQIELMDSPRKLAISPDGKNAYVVSEVSHSVSIFSVDTVSGYLTYAGAFQNDSLLHWAVDLVFSPSGEYIYVAAEISNAISVFRRNLDSGQLSLISSLEAIADDIPGLVAIYGLAVSPDGRHVYTASWLFGSVDVFEVNENTDLVPGYQHPNPFLQLGKGNRDVRGKIVPNKGKMPVMHFPNMGEN